MFSILVDIFYPSVERVFSKEGVFNSHACSQQLTEAGAVKNQHPVI